MKITFPDNYPLLISHNKNNKQNDQEWKSVLKIKSN